MENKLPDFGFNIQRILDCGFIVEETINPEPDDMLISYGMLLYFNVDENWAQFSIRVDMLKSPNIIFATGTVLTRFGINDLKAFVDEDNDLTWPVNSLETMFGISFNHMRAIVAKNMAGTKFANHIVPLVNPTTLFEQLMSSDPLYKVEKIETPSGIRRRLILMEEELQKSLDLARDGIEKQAAETEKMLEGLLSKEKGNLQDITIKGKNESKKTSEKKRRTIGNPNVKSKTKN